MRFNKASRKTGKRKKGRREAGPPSRALWAYLGIGLLAVALFYLGLYAGHQRQLRKVRREKVQDDMDRICSALILFRQDHGRYPSREEGLDVLARDPRLPGPSGGQADPRRPYLDRLPADPWGAPYVYELRPRDGVPVLLSRAADAEPGGTGEASDERREGCPSGLLPLQ